MRNDPTDNGGLFIGRRPGTAPVRFRAVPERGGSARRLLDAALAAALLALIALINLSFWGPIPLAWLWVGSQVEYRTGSVSVGIFCAFVGMLLTLMGALVIAKRLDYAWILVRRAASHDQREGVLGRIFAVTAVVGVAAFAFWFLVIQGPGSGLFPAQG
jgi:hypothetical protein